MGTEEEKINIEKQGFYAVCYDIDFCTQDGFLFESSGIKSIRDITQPMNAQSYKIIGGTHFYNSENKKSKRQAESQDGEYVGFTVEAMRVFRLKCFEFQIYNLLIYWNLLSWLKLNFPS